MSNPGGGLGFLSAPPAKPRLPQQEVERLYPRLRMQVFAGIFLGYAGFYLIRNNLTLVSALMKNQGLMTDLEYGIIANAVLLAYGFSKFFSAVVSDRANARYFMPLGLALSALMNFVVAFVPAVAASVSLFASVMFLNGWVQGMGWPPSGRILVYWFSTRERGWKTSIWNCAHNVGGAGVGAAAALALEMTGNDWRSAFWFPALIALGVALLTFVLLRDRPEAVGLPPIEEYRDDPAKVEVRDEAVHRMGIWGVIRTYILTDRTIMLLAVCNVFVYTLRYGVLNWIPIFLHDVRGADIADGITGFAVFELAGIVGTLLCGWLSDRVFNGYRTGAGKVFLGALAAAIAIYWLLPAAAPIWISIVMVAIIGGLIYGPVMLIGLQAIDLSPRAVCGQAAGFTGLFGYVLGATLASSGVGLMVHNFGWDFTFVALILCTVVAWILMAMVGQQERALMEAHDLRCNDLKCTSQKAAPKP